MGKDRGGKKDGGMGGGDAHQKKRKGEGGGGKGDAKVQKLGGWHPKMLALKSGGGAPENGKVSLVLFYQYIKPLWSESRAQEAVDLVVKVGAELSLGGRVRVGREGFNGTLSGSADALRSFAEHLKDFDRHFEETDFKFIDGLTSDKHFKDLKVVPVQELVFYGVKPDEGVTLGEGGVHLDPKDYHQKMAEKDAVIIDVRNHYEADIGKFNKQEKVGGAKYIDPKMRKSTDFKEWLSKDETKKQLEGKQVLMYCTGGVRCERASQIIKHEIGDSVKGVFQLKGGIEKYMMEFPDGGFWAGKNKVFDKREACGIEDINGTGGVVRKDKGKDKGKNKEPILGKCCVCSKPWERYIGKKKCFSCGVPVLMCDGCMTLKPDKGTKEQQLSVRCPLCKEEGRTEAADEMEYTENGTAAKIGDKKLGTVLKWGGGHAKKKHEERQKQRQQEHRKANASKPCKFGEKCSKAGCRFLHPNK